jgi:hypothetical protein
MYWPILVIDVLPELGYHHVKKACDCLRLSDYHLYSTVRSQNVLALFIGAITMSDSSCSALHT